MYSRVKEIADQKPSYKNKIVIIKADSTLAMEEDEVKRRWDDFIGELFHA